MRTHIKNRGFTLIELVIAMTVMGILLAFAVPMYDTLVSNNRTRAAAYSLASALTFARDEAVKRNNTVSVVPLAGGWNTGWEVGTGGTTLATNETVSALNLTGPVAGVSYLPNGRLSTPGTVLFTVSASDTGYTRCIFIDPGGRATLNPGERYDGSCV